MDLNRKIDFAIKLLLSIPQDGPIELSYSGGKDSDVILELAKMSGIPFEAIYKNTTIDPPGTIAHCRENGVKIIHPTKTFLKLIEERGMPSRFTRFCCSVLKEYKIHDRAIQGIRRSESTKRAARYKEPEYCRVYPKGEKARFYLPILEWNNDDVSRFIEDRGIKCHPLYYNEQGQFLVEKRLGCIGCPMATEWKRREQYRQYPRLLKAQIKAANKYFVSHPNAKIHKYFNSIYDMFYRDLFYRSSREYISDNEGLLFPRDSKAILEKYFNINLTI